MSSIEDAPANPTPAGSQVGHDEAIALRDWDKAWKQPFLEAISRIPNVSAAARFARIHRDTAYNEVKLDPEFAAAWDEANQVGRERVDQILFRRATQGEPETITKTVTKRDGDGNVIEETTVTVQTQRVSNNLLTLWLRAHWPEKYGNVQSIRHTGAEGGPIEIEVYRTSTPERMLELARIAVEVNALTSIDGEASEDEYASDEEVFGEDEV